MALVVRLPLLLRHACSTPDGGDVRALLLDDEVVVLTAPRVGGGPLWESHGGVPVRLRKVLRRGPQLFLPLAVPVEVARMLAPSSRETWTPLSSARWRPS